MFSGDQGRIRDIFLYIEKPRYLFMKTIIQRVIQVHVLKHRPADVIVHEKSSSVDYRNTPISSIEDGVWWYRPVDGI